MQLPSSSIICFNMQIKGNCLIPLTPFMGGLDDFCLVQSLVSHQAMLMSGHGLKSQVSSVGSWQYRPVAHVRQPED